VRLGLRRISGLREEDAARLVLARGEEPYRSVEDVWRRPGLVPARSITWPRPTLSAPNSTWP